MFLKCLDFHLDTCQPNVPPTTQQMIKYAAVLRTYLLQGIAARPGGLGKGTTEKPMTASVLQPWFCKQGTILPFILREQKPIFDVSQSNVSLICHCVPTAGSRALGWANLVPVINVTELQQTAPSSGHSAATAALTP